MHLASVDLNLAVVLHALLTERSVSRAGKRLGLSQSATSHALARLRQLVGDPLVLRTPRGVEPTARGDAIASPLAAALEALERALLAPPTFDPSTARRAFRVGASDYAEFLLLPPLLARIAEEAPGVDLWGHSHGDEVHDRLRSGELDLALGVARKEQSPGIQSAPLLEERFVCVVREGHPLLRGALTVARFVAARHAFIAPRGRPGGAVDDALAALGHKRRVALAVPHFLVAPHVIARTDLVLTVAERIALAFAALLPLRVLPPPVTLPGFTLSLIWHERNEVDPAQAWLRSRISEVAAGLAEPLPRRRKAPVRKTPVRRSR